MTYDGRLRSSSQVSQCSDRLINTDSFINDPSLVVNKHSVGFTISQCNNDGSHYRCMSRKKCVVCTFKDKTVP